MSNLDLNNEEEIEISNDKIITRTISKEVKTSFLDYSMSVIVSRAIPDIRDGLKPVHRRILYTMLEEGMTPDKKHRKSATAVGAVMGKYHPHGDTAIYDSMVRMAQNFTYRYPLVDGHGNFGSIDGDGAAASRYTEAKLEKISMELLRDINKDTVNFTPNYDGEEKEPEILPSRFPNILVNGNMGIAVGMATNIPPHNLTEVINAAVAYIDNPDITTKEIMEHIKGPDFPTKGSILGNSGIVKAFETGRGSITIRGKVDIIEDKGRTKLIITELPYQVNKSSLVKRIAELVRDKQIDGIADLSDVSALEGIKIIIDVKKDYNANVLLNQLYKNTQLQVSFGINMLMLVDGLPQTMPIVKIYEKYIDYQKEIIVRRTTFDLDRAEKREHILEGLKIALDNIDEIIRIIKENNDDKEIIEEFNRKYGLSEIQSQAILEMKLRRLSGLEREKIEKELFELLETIKQLKGILADEQKVLNIIKEEMLEIRDKYGDERLTEIDMTAIEYIEDESLIPVEESIVTLTNKGYIKRVPVDTYRNQNRGGVGIKGLTTNEEDFVENLINLSTHDYILFFSNFGKVYRIKGYEIPVYSRQSKGLPIVNLLPLDAGETVNSIIKYSESEEEYNYLLFITKNGLVKRTEVKEFESIRNNGKKAIILKENDELIAVRKTTGENEVVIASSDGRIVRTVESEIRSMGRSTSGVRGINLNDSEYVIGGEVGNEESEVLVVTENGYGKRTAIGEYRLTKRGSKGVKAMNITNKTGNLISLKTVEGDEDLMIITDVGIIIRISVNQVSVLKRATQGVRLINLKEDQKVAAVAKIINEDVDFIDEEEQTEDNVSRETLK